MSAPDVIVVNHGTISTFALRSPRVRSWWRKHVQDGQSWAGARVVEHRYVDDIIDGLAEAGFQIN